MRHRTWILGLALLASLGGCGAARTEGRVETTVMVVPRWGGGPTDDFYPWLTERLAGTAEVVALALPDPQEPRIDVWPAEVARRASEVEGPLLVVAHSVGCQAALRAAATMRRTAPTRLLCVADWVDVDEPWPTIRPWIETPLDAEAARSGYASIHLLVSDDDPFTADHEATRRAFRERLGASDTLVPGGRHFNREGWDAVERAVRDALGR